MNQVYGEHVWLDWDLKWSNNAVLAVSLNKSHDKGKTENIKKSS